MGGEGVWVEVDRGGDCGWGRRETIFCVRVINRSIREVQEEARPNKTVGPGCCTYGGHVTEAFRRGELIRYAATPLSSEGEHQPYRRRSSRRITNQRTLSARYIIILRLCGAFPRELIYILIAVSSIQRDVVYHTYAGFHRH